MTVLPLVRDAVRLDADVDARVGIEIETAAQVEARRIGDCKTALHQRVGLAPLVDALDRRKHRLCVCLRVARRVETDRRGQPRLL